MHFNSFGYYLGRHRGTGTKKAVLSKGWGAQKRKRETEVSQFPAYVAYSIKLGPYENEALL